MEVPGLAEDRYRIRLSLDKCDDVAVFIRGHLGATGRAKCRNLGLGKFLLFDILEEGDVFGIASRPAALNIINPQLIEPMGNTDLVLQQERDVFRLGTIPQGRVVQCYKAHHYLPNLNILYVPND